MGPHGGSRSRQRHYRPQGHDSRHHAAIQPGACGSWARPQPQGSWGTTTRRCHCASRRRFCSCPLSSRQMEGYGACYRKIVRDINTLLACVKKAAEFARIGPAETHAVETRPGRDGGDADASPAARPGGIGAPITGRQNGGRTSGGGRVVGCPLPSCVGCLGDRRPWIGGDTSQPGENQELIGRGRGIDGEICHPQPSDRRRPPAQAAEHERRRRRLTGELVAQGSPWRADTPKGDVRRPETEQVRSRDHAPGTAPASCCVRGMQLDADVSQSGQSQAPKLTAPMKHRPGDP